MKVKYSLNIVYLFFITLFTFSCYPVWAEKEIPLALLKAEGSKSFDLEINEFNYKGIIAFKKGYFEVAADFFLKSFQAFSKSMRS